MDKVYIKSIVQTILNSNFKVPEKKRIHEYHDRIQFACPYCGDSATQNSAKRGNIWFNKLIYVCFNCGKKTNFDRLSKDFNIRLDPDKKLQIIDHLNSAISYKDAEDDFMDAEFESLINMSDLDRIFNNGEHVITDFKPVTKDSNVFNYLTGRGIEEKMLLNIYEGRYWVNSDRYEPIIILLNRRGDKVLGIQIRNLKDGKRRIFKIYNFETIYKWVNGVDDIEDMDINQVIIYNKLSYYFNILNIDFSRCITIFEGYLDSLFYPNSIGVVGVNTDMKFIEANNLELQYFFDNDQAGFQKSEQKIKEGYSVFLWKKLFQDIVDKKKSTDPYGLMYRINKVKDLNKLAELVKEPYSKLDLRNFFSKDIMDIKWIPKREKKEYRKWKSRSV
jgi:DNA-directed RNA polymerase subunit RPC12/RpoP